MSRAPMLDRSIDEAWTADPVGVSLSDGVRLVDIRWLLDRTPVERGAALRDEQLARHAVGDRTLETVLATMREVSPPER